MDLNYLLSRHQLALVRSTRAASSEARLAHRGLADGYARRVAELQAGTGATTAPLSGAAR